MAGFSALSRAGHLEALHHLFAYLKTHKRSKLVMDSSYPKVPQPEPQDWHQFYGDVKEEISPDAPKTRGNYVEMATFTDSDHANDKLNRRSRTGVFISGNRSLICWHSKKQLSVETSSFGSEMAAVKSARVVSWPALQVANDGRSPWWIHT